MEKRRAASYSLFACSLRPDIPIGRYSNRRRYSHTNYRPPVGGRSGVFNISPLLFLGRFCENSVIMSPTCPVFLQPHKRNKNMDFHEISSTNRKNKLKQLSRWWSKIWWWSKIFDHHLDCLFNDFLLIVCEISWKFVYDFPDLSCVLQFFGFQKGNNTRMFTKFRQQIAKNLFKNCQDGGPKYSTTISIIFSIIFC